MKRQPKFEFSKRQIEFLQELHSFGVRIAKLLGIATKTLFRRRQKFQIDDEQNLSSITNGELRNIMQSIYEYHLRDWSYPHVGCPV